MKLIKINKVVILFLCTIILFIGGIWQFLQSERFGEMVSTKIGRKLVREFKLDFEFSNVEINVLPIGATFKNVKLEGPDGELSISASRLGIYFSIWDLLSNRLALETFAFEDGSIFYNEGSGAVKSNSIEKKSYSKSYEVLRSYINRKAPIKLKKISLKDIYVKTKYFESYVSKLNASIYNSYINTSGKLIDCNIKDDKNLFALDSIYFNTDFQKNNLLIKSFEAFKDLDFISLSGKLYDENNELHIHTKGESINDIKSFRALIPEVNGISGVLRAFFTLDGPLINPDIKAEILGKHLLSRYANVDKLSLKVSKHDDVISIEELELSDKNAVVKLEQKIDLFNIKTKSLINKKAKLHLKDVPLTTALYFLRDTVGGLRGDYTGDLTLKFDSQIDFIFPKGTKLDNFSFANKNDIILSNSSLSFNDSYISIVGNSTLFNLDIEFPASHIYASGEIKEDSVSFQVKAPIIDLEEFGPISGEKLSGSGQIDLNITGAFDNTILYFDAKIKDFTVLDFYLGDSAFKADLSLTRPSLLIKSFNSVVGDTSIRSKDGSIFFDNDGLIDLSIIVNNLNEVTSRKVFKSYLNNKAEKYFDMSGVGFDIDGKVDIDGAFDIKNIRILSDLKGDYLSIYNEKFEDISIKSIFLNNTLNLKKLSINKADGVLSGKGTVNFLTSEYVYDFRFINIFMTDFKYYNDLNLGYDGKVNAEFSGSGKGEDLVSKSKILISDGRVGPEKLGVSTLMVNTNGKLLFVNGKLLGKSVEYDGLFDFSHKNRKRSYISIDVKDNNLNKVFGILSEHNISDLHLGGKISGNVIADFDFYNIENINLDASISEFEIVKNNIAMKLLKDKSIITIENGEIKEWDISIQGRDSEISSIGKGDLRNEIKIENIFKIDSSFLGIISDNILKSEGKIEGSEVLNFVNRKFTHHVELIGSDLFLKLRNVPEAVEKINFRVVAENNEILIEKLSGNYGNGNVTIDGNVKLVIPYPEIDLSLNIDKSQFSFLKKSSIISSGRMELTGNKFPYVLKGGLSILHGEVSDSAVSFLSAAKSKNSFTKFIPETSNNNFDFIFYDITINALSPVHVHNSLVDLRIAGKGKVIGDYSNPSIQGKVEIVPNESKLIFKGHDFSLLEGIIELDGSLKEIDTSFKFIGNSNINKYKIKLNLAGNNDDFDINLSAEPTLSKGDILSLLTLGITSDQSKDLKDSERQSLTSMGLGSFIVDQLEINQELRSSLGVKVSLLPEFSQDNGSLIKERTEGQSTTRLKSATKIKLQKKVGDKVNLSVSSTMGGTAGQKQEMNVDYNVNKVISLQGIYEIKSNDGEESNNSPDSAGVDLKFRWSF